MLQLSYIKSSHIFFVKVPYVCDINRRIQDCATKSFFCRYASLSWESTICMFVFVVWQINCPSLWVRSLTYVRCLTTKATIRRLKYVRSPQSVVWKLMSQVHNRESDVRSLTKSEVWCPTYVRKLYELCPKSEVLRMSVQKLESKNQSQKSKVCPKSKIRV